MIGTIAALALAAGAPSPDLDPAGFVRFHTESGRPAASAKAICAADYPGDFVMQDFCRKAFADGVIKVGRAGQRHPGEREISAALVQCIADYQRGEWVEWILAGFCAEAQVDAWERLNR